MSLWNIVGTLWLLVWFLSGFLTLKILEERPGIQRSRALPLINMAALLCGPVVLLLLFSIQFLRAPLRNFLERLRLDDGIRMTFRRNGETISEEHLEHAIPRSVRRVFKTALEHAVLLRASDLLVEPLPNGGALMRIRTDGSLKTFRRLSPADAAALLRLSGFFAGGDPGLEPVNGTSVEFSSSRGTFALRIGMLKVAGGTRIAFHLVLPERPIETPADLGLDPIQTDVISRYLGLRSGLVVIAGDSGSGRSLTLERILDLADLKNRSAILVSRSTPGKLRPEVMRLADDGNAPEGNAFGMTRDGGGVPEEMVFAAMGQSPDLLAVDEAANRRVLSELIAAARGGMLVIMVLRTRSLAETLQRLIVPDVPPKELAAALRLMIQLHPLRRLCDCAQPYIPTPEESACLDAAGVSGDELRHAVGCPKCEMTGYRGRTAAFELYAPGEALLELLGGSGTSSPTAIRQAFENERGEHAAYCAGCRTAALGLTSLDEAATLLQSTEKEVMP